MEESYSSDDDIHFGPLTTRELRRHLTKNVRPIVKRRHTVGLSPDSEELSCGAEIPSFIPDVPELIKEVASNLNISLSCENLLCANESKTELEGNFVEKVSQILSDNDKSKSFEDTEAITFKLDRQPMDLTLMGNNIRMSCLLDNINATLVDYTFSGKDMSNDCKRLDDSSKENILQNVEDDVEVIVLTSDEETSFDEKLSIIIEKLDEDLAMEEKKVVETSIVDVSVISLNDSNNFGDDKEKNTNLSVPSDEACGVKLPEKESVFNYSDVSLDYEYEENKESDQIMVEHESFKQDHDQSININSQSISMAEFRFNEKLVESSFEETIHPENESLDDTYNSQETSNQSLDFNNTLEQIEYFLNKEKEESAQKSILKATELSSQKKNVTESHIPIMKLNKPNRILETNQNQHESKDKFCNIISPIAAYIHKPTREQNAEFKMPNKPPPKTPSVSKAGYLKNIVSPVSLYIKNTPTSPLIQHVPNKVVKALPISSNYKQQTPLQENSLPCVSYKPAKHKLFTEEKDLNLPKNIKKLGPQGTLIIKHEKRIGSTKENVFEEDIDASLLNTTNRDVSVLTSKNCYI